MSVRIAVTGGSGFIGTNFAKAAEDADHEVKSLDIRPPKDPRQRQIWVDVDVCDADRVRSVLTEWRPDAVIHLAARADTDSDTLEDYAVNSEGTRRVAEAAAEVPSIRRLIHASTQYVFTLGRTPAHDEDYAPFTAYGESKVRSEQVLRGGDWPFTWTIVRPTNIWGPWHPRYPEEFWKVVARGLYFHPGRKRVRRAYGYVGNVAQQLLAMIAAPEEKIGRAHV